MAIKKNLKLEPAPLAYPNGGGLQAMATQKNSLKEKELALAKAKNELEIARIHQKHATKPSTTKPSKGASNGNK